MKRFPEAPHACLITSGKAEPSNFQTEKAAIIATVRAAIADGVDLIQIREKAIPATMLFELVSEVVEVSKSSEALVLVNGRPDIAIAARADGVHLPTTSFTPDVIRRVFDQGLVIGVSAHSIDEAITSARSGADFILFGPVFATPGKGPAVGEDVLRSVCKAVGSVPVLALGGIDETNVEQALMSGAAGVAAIRSLSKSETRQTIVKRMKALAGLKG